jgi:hypothetical protein
MRARLFVIVTLICCAQAFAQSASEKLIRSQYFLYQQQVNTIAMQAVALDTPVYAT